ncbi:MAG: hypothetical protein K2J08_08770 [Ruminococcus sp.]|nr:hypothetical protein [Ruminococcus sp.]
MAYIGENRCLSFRNSFCEPLPSARFSTSEASDFGRTLSRFFGRFSIGCDGFANLPVLYAVCCGISECGKDVFVCENTDLPSFRFALPLLSSDCGIFIGGSSSPRIYIFGKNAFSLPSATISAIIKSPPAKTAEKCGKIKRTTSFRDIYTENLAQSSSNISCSIPASVSCGNKSVRSLWLEFFSGNDENLVFQVSDDGQRVNAFSADLGFISHEKLTLAHVLKISESGQAVFLPDNFHYIAESPNIRRFSESENIPTEAVQQRFLNDPLYMILQLTADLKDFSERIKNLPPLATSRREIIISSPPENPKTIDRPDGRIIITRSGRNRIMLTAQALSAETASELCNITLREYTP